MKNVQHCNYHASQSDKTVVTNLQKFHSNELDLENWET
jgi:hypothetical protein